MSIAGRAVLHHGATEFFASVLCGYQRLHGEVYADTLQCVLLRLGFCSHSSTGTRLHYERAVVVSWMIRN